MLGCLVMGGGWRAGPSPRSRACLPPAARMPDWDKLEPVCGKCHNSTDWAGSLAFDTLSADDIGADAEIWEKTVRKLRGHLMPPPGEEQPAAGHRRCRGDLAGRHSWTRTPRRTRIPAMWACIA